MNRFIIVLLFTAGSAHRMNKMRFYLFLRSSGSSSTEVEKRAGLREKEIRVDSAEEFNYKEEKTCT